MGGEQGPGGLRRKAAELAAIMAEGLFAFILADSFGLPEGAPAAADEPPPEPGEPLPMQ